MPGGPGKLRTGGVIRSEKWENHRNSTHTKIKFLIIFIQFFFSTMDIEKFSWKMGEAGREFLNLIVFFLFFLIISLCNITYQQFYCCLHWYLTHSYSMFCFDVFPPPPWKVHFWQLKMQLLPQFLTKEAETGIIL